MQLRIEAKLKVKFKGGGYAWYRVGKYRHTEKLVAYFFDKQDFIYGKLYAYDQRTKQTGQEIGFFGVNEKTGEIYYGGIFAY